MTLYYNIVIILEIYGSGEGEFPYGQCGKETGFGEEVTEVCQILKAVC